MKEKLQNSNDKDWIKYKKDYSKGNSSPFREWQEKSGSFNQQSNAGRIEPVMANPDVLSETQSLWYKPEASPEEKERVAKIWNKLTQKQRKVLELVGFEGKTFEHTAIILGVSKRTIQTTIERIRKKVLKSVVQKALIDPI